MNLNPVNIPSGTETKGDSEAAKRPIVSVHLSIQKLAKQVYRLQASGDSALAKFLLDLTDSLVDGDPSRSAFGAELLSEARAYSDAKAAAGRLGAIAKHGKAMALPSTGMAMVGQTDQSDQTHKNSFPPADDRSGTSANAKRGKVPYVPLL